MKLKAQVIENKGEGNYARKSGGVVNFVDLAVLDQDKPQISNVILNARITYIGQGEAYNVAKALMSGDTIELDVNGLRAVPGGIQMSAIGVRKVK